MIEELLVVLVLAVLAWLEKRRRQLNSASAEQIADSEPQRPLQDSVPPHFAVIRQRLLAKPVGAGK